MQLANCDQLFCCIEPLAISLAYKPALARFFIRLSLNCNRTASYEFGDCIECVSWIICIKLSLAISKLQNDSQNSATKFQLMKAKQQSRTYLLIPLPQMPPLLSVGRNTCSGSPYLNAAVERERTDRLAALAAFRHTDPYLDRYLDQYI